MAYSPENNPYIPGDPYSYDLKWIVKRLKRTLSPSDAIIGSAWVTATGTSGPVQVHELNIIKDGTYLIVASSYQSRTGYSTSERSQMASGFTVYHQNSSGTDINSYEDSTTLTSSGDNNVAAIFTCKAGDKIRFVCQQFAGSSGATLTEQTFYVRASMIKLF